MRVSFYKTTRRETLDEGSNRHGNVHFFRSTIKEKDKEKENDRDTDEGREKVCHAPSLAFRVRCSQKFLYGNSCFRVSHENL
jgi:hypothetical protein